MQRVFVAPRSGQRREQHTPLRRAATRTFHTDKQMFVDYATILDVRKTTAKTRQLTAETFCFSVRFWGHIACIVLNAQPVNLTLS